tara:strand:- start:54 stop:434 length:381 start_codon:yes stop_codon:yes gene_type:complete
MKTLKDLGEAHYEDIRYSFDVYYYPGYNDDEYVGTFKNIMEIKGYEAQFKAPTIEELVKIADQFLQLVKHVRVDRFGMKDVVQEWFFNNGHEYKFMETLVETHNELQDIAGFSDKKVQLREKSQRV